jgi:hypothetical protein
MASVNGPEGGQVSIYIDELGMIMDCKITG